MAEVQNAPLALNGQLIDIGTVAASNIAAALNLPSLHVNAIRQAIRDEISALSSHFTLAIADVQTQYEIDVAKIKSEWSFVKANKVPVIAVLAFMLLVGVGIGKLFT